jgi:hypothetical protein
MLSGISKEGVLKQAGKLMHLNLNDNEISAKTVSNFLLTKVTKLRILRLKGMMFHEPFIINFNTKSL